MAKPLISLGPHVFQVIGLNGKEVETTTEAAWAEFGRFGLSDGAHFTGLRRSSLAIRGVLFPDAIGGLADYEAIRSSQYAGKALPLLQMGRALSASMLGQVTIERVTDLAEYAGKKVAFTVELKGYV